VFIVKPIVTLHETYQEFVTTQLRLHYSGGLLVLVNKDWPLIFKLWITDLSGITMLLQDSYSTRGPAPRDPASMLRSFLIFLSTKPEIGITAWVDELYRVPLYAILSGFVPGDVPGVGTFYDFFARLWAASEKNFKSHKLRRKRKPKKGKRGEKAPTTTPGRVKRLVSWMIRYLGKQNDLPMDRLFHFFQSEFLAYQQGWVYWVIWVRSLLPVTVLLSLLLPIPVVNLLVIAMPKALRSATIPAFILSLTAIQAGIVHGNAFLMDTTCTC
jgi:hypothetical protein